MKFRPAGPKRFEHQIKALRRVIETRGVTALLMEPGTGKTAVVLDYLSLLALQSAKHGVGEVRALIVSPKAAVDNWVLQAETYVHEGVNVWAEALGGSVRQKALSMQSRGPAPVSRRVFQRKKDFGQAPFRAINADRAELLFTRPSEGVRGPSDLPEPRLVLLSTNFEAFSSRQQVGSRTMADVLLRGVERFKPDVIVADESHRLKGVSSNVSRLMARVGVHADRRLILTGTAMPSGPLDVFAQWRFLEPYAFGRWNPETRKMMPATFDNFEARFAVKGGYMGREVVEYRNLDELQRVMARNSVVVKKEDALDLPTMTQTVVPFALSSREAGAYAGLKKQMAVDLSEGRVTAGNRLTQMLRLRQITAGHVPTDDGGLAEVGDSKNRVIESLVHDTLAGERRIVVFTQFKHEIEVLRRLLSRSGTEVVTIEGGTSQEDRLAIRQRFGGDDPARIVLLAQVQTMSLSVNELVSASHAIFASLSWRRDDIVQAQDRLHRIGQRLPVTIWVPLARGTVDEVIWDSHTRGTELEAGLLDHVHASTNNLR